MVKISVVNQSENALPAYQTAHSAGLDLSASLENPIVLLPMQRALVATGLYLQIPEGFEAQIRPRSGLAIKHGITLLNSPGTIDSDYRGEIGVILVNLSNSPFTIENGMRIAQMVVARYEKVEWDLTETVEATTRGKGGFGHTGL